MVYDFLMNFNLSTSRAFIFDSTRRSWPLLLRTRDAINDLSSDQRTAFRLVLDFAIWKYSASGSRGWFRLDEILSEQRARIVSGQLNVVSIRWCTRLIRSLDGMMKAIVEWAIFSFVLTLHRHCTMCPDDEDGGRARKEGPKNILIRDNAPKHVHRNFCLILSSRCGTEQLQAHARRTCRRHRHSYSRPTIEIRNTKKKKNSIRSEGEKKISENSFPWEKFHF